MLFPFLDVNVSKKETVTTTKYGYSKLSQLPPVQGIYPTKNGENM
jgi:hypothetical protein